MARKRETDREHNQKFEKKWHKGRRQRNKKEEREI